MPCHRTSAPPSFGGERRFVAPQQLYQFAKADDCSDDTVARAVDRPTRTKVSNPLPIWRGTGNSNPSPSSAESAANFVFEREAGKGPRRVMPETAFRAGRR